MTSRSSSARVSEARSKPGEPRPKADIARRRVLRLERPDLLDGAGQRQVRPLEQQLAGQDGAVQVPGRQDPLGHTRIMDDRPWSAPRSAVYPHSHHDLHPDRPASRGRLALPDLQPERLSRPFRHQRRWKGRATDACR